jgi:hypothetical protein
MLAIGVLDHADAGPRLGGDIVEILEAFRHVAGGGGLERVPGLDLHGLGIAHDRRQVGEWAVQVLDRIAEATTVGHHDLDQIARGRGIDRAQKFELARRQHIGHGRRLGVCTRTMD